MAGAPLGAPAMMLHGRAPSAQHTHAHDQHSHHHPATPGQNDCCEWCLSNCVAPATLPHAPTIALIRIPAAAVAAVTGPGRIVLVRLALLPYPLGPPASPAA
jgi:hypothetical protein